jgi:hypothetical protein
VQGYGEAALNDMALAGARTLPAPSQDHSRTAPTRNAPVLLTLSRRRPDAGPDAPPVSACAESPLAGFVPN